jgi:hypothetical protein
MKRRNARKSHIVDRDLRLVIAKKKTIDVIPEIITDTTRIVIVTVGIDGTKEKKKKGAIDHIRPETDIVAAKIIQHLRVFSCLFF